MSRFSGKCDFYDGVVAIHCDGDTDKLEEFLAETDIYIRGRDERTHKVVVQNEKDAVKYYPYLESIAAFNRNGRNTIVLSSRPFIDSEEMEILGWHIDDARKYWKKCKRNKVECNVDEYITHRSSWSCSEYLDRPIMEKIIKDGEKAEFDDIHDNMHEYFRRRWFEEMVRVGYSEWEAFNWCFNEFYPNDEVIIKRLGRALKKKED